LIFCSIDSKSCAVALLLVVTTSEIWEENNKLVTNTNKTFRK